MPESECLNMSKVYKDRLDKTEKARIEKLEIFDEFEEWELLQKHYCLCLGKRVKDQSVSSLIYI